MKMVLSLLPVGLLLLLTACSPGRETVATGSVVESRGETEERPTEEQSVSSASIHRWFVEGSLAAMRSDYEEAIGWYDAILRENPDHAPTLAALARCYDALSLSDSARDYAYRTLRVDRKDVPSLRLLADLLTAEGEFDSAAALYEEVVRLKPDDLQARFMIARTWDHRNPSLAITHYKYIRDNIAEDYLALSNLYQMQSLERRAAEGAGTLRLLIAHNPGEGELHDLHCNLWIEAGEYDSAIKGLELAGLYLEEPAEREEFLLAQLQLADLRLRSYVPENDPIQRFIKALVGMAALECEGTRCRYLSGMVALRGGEEEIADSLLKRISISGNLQAFEWIEAAELYRRKNEQERMLSVMGEGAGRYEEYPEVLFELGCALLKTGSRDSGRTLLDRAVGVDPTLEEAWKVLAEDYVATGHIPQGVGAYERAVEAAPYDPELLNDYARLLADAKIHMEKGTALIDRALEMEPENERFLTTRGLLDYRQSDYLSAASYLRKAVDAGGATAERFELLGDAMFALGEREEARKAWEEGLRLDNGTSQRTERLHRKLNDLLDKL